MDRPRLAAAGVLAAFAGLAGYVALALPPCAESDELTNLQYVEFLRAREGLPDPWTDRVWNDKHPPLYFAFGAGLVSLVERAAGILPDQVSLPGPFRARLPLAEKWASGGVEVHGASIYALRGLSILCALVALLFAGKCVRLVLPAEPWAAVGSVAFLAFNARFLFQSAVINNDAACVALSSVVAWLILGGAAGERRYLPLLAGLASGAAFLVKTNALFLLAPGLLLPLLRRGRPVREALLFLAGWLLLAVLWIARSLRQFGEPLGIGGVVARSGFIFFPGEPSASMLDESVGGLLWSFWDFPHGVTPGRVATLLCLALAGLGLVGSASRCLHPALRAEAPHQARAAVLSLAAGAVLYALVAAGDLVVRSMAGRLLFPGLAFYAVILALGLPVVLRLRPGSLALPLAGGACALLAPVFFLRTLLPRHLLPKSAFGEGTAAYVDCGHPTARDSRLRGSDLEPPFLFGRPVASLTASVDAERVVHDLAGLDPSVPMRLEVTYASADPFYDDGWKGDFEPDVRHVVQRLRANDLEVHGPVTVTHVPRTLSYRLPREAISGGRLALSFEKVAGLYATVSEIRLERAAEGLTASFEAAAGAGRVVRVSAPEEDLPPYLSAWFESRDEPGRVLEHHLHEIRDGRHAPLFELPDLTRGRYRFCAARVDPERSPFATVEAETLEHPGWRAFGDRAASGRYMVRATEKWTRPGAAIAVEVPGAPAGVYLASVRFAASGAGGRAFGDPLPDTRGRWREARALVPCEGGRLCGEVVFAGTGRLAVDRIAFAPVAGACARPEVVYDFEVP